MAIIDTIKAKARARVMHIVLPEGEETRNVHAASIIQKEGLARLTLLGDAEKIKAAYPDAVSYTHLAALAERLPSRGRSDAGV